MLRLITSNQCSCVVLAVICSLAAVAIWDILIAAFKEKKKFGLIFGWMWVALIFTAIPVVYLADKIMCRFGMLHQSEGIVMGQGMWYMCHDVFVPLIYILLIVWLVGVMRKALEFWIQKDQVNRMVMLKDKIKDERVLGWFYRAPKRGWIEAFHRII